MDSLMTITGMTQEQRYCYNEARRFADRFGVTSETEFSRIEIAIRYREYKREVEWIQKELVRLALFTLEPTVWRVTDDGVVEVPKPPRAKSEPEQQLAAMAVEVAKRYGFDLKPQGKEN